MDEPLGKKTWKESLKFDGSNANYAVTASVIYIEGVVEKNIPAGKDNLRNLTFPFIWQFRFEDRSIGTGNNDGWIVNLQQHGSYSVVVIDITDTMVQEEPSVIGFHRRSADSDFIVVPVFISWGN